MGKMIYLIGKSSTGKDTLYKHLLNWKECPLETVVLYTTRPVRDHETDGEEYHFTDEDGYQRLCAEGKVIEARTYQTFYGPWRYFTVDDGSIDLNKNNYLVIGTLESFRKTADYFTREKVLPVYIEVEDGVRLERAIQRERQQETPKYEEMCRRFLADAEDFSEEKLKEAGIVCRFENDCLETCLQKIKKYIQENL